MRKYLDECFASGMMSGCTFSIYFLFEGLDIDGIKESRVAE